jgi:hypothetical protein
LGVAGERGLHGYSLLGEMPHLFAQLPFPKAALAVLEVFTRFAQIELDFTELSQQAKAMEEQLGQILAQVEQAIGEEQEPGEDEAWRTGEASEQSLLEPEDQQRIEQLFEQATANKAKAYELKAELDRLDVFKDYEDRFLDLFKK